MKPEFGELITCGNNWVIVNRLDDLDDLEQLVIDADPRDFSKYTTASGGSVQKYFTTPPWASHLSMGEQKQSSNWISVKEKYENIIGQHLVHHGHMPFEWGHPRIISGWTVTGEEGSYHTPHEHGRDYVSCVIYTATPNDNPELSNGSIYFVLHADAYSELYHPANRLLNLIPGKGMIIIFPSWIIHGTVPQGPGIRTTVNFDLRGRPNDG